jgi:hypothetical protein
VFLCVASIWGESSTLQRGSPIGIGLAGVVCITTPIGIGLAGVVGITASIGVRRTILIRSTIGVVANIGIANAVCIGTIGIAAFISSHDGSRVLRGLFGLTSGSDQDQCSPPKILHFFSIFSTR